MVQRCLFWGPRLLRKDRHGPNQASPTLRPVSSLFGRGSSVRFPASTDESLPFLVYFARVAPGLSVSGFI